MLIKILREGLGRLIALGDWVSRPRPFVRDVQSQDLVNHSAKSLALYQFYACPFCVKVRRKIHKLNVPITLRDAQNDSQHRQELAEKGGKIKVPCLRIEEGNSVRWLYESNDIIHYLEERYRAV